MSFEFKQNTGILKHTTEKGQLLSISDDTAQHTVGSIYYDDKNNKTYVYAYNGVGATVAADAVYVLIPKYSSTATNYTRWQVDGMTDDTTKVLKKYVCVPAAAVLSTYYGWNQVQGEVDVDTTDTNFFTVEAYDTDGDQLFISGAVVASAAIHAGGGIRNDCFAITKDVTTSDGLDGATIYLLGREVIASS